MFQTVVVKIKYMKSTLISSKPFHYKASKKTKYT